VLRFSHFRIFHEARFKIIPSCRQLSLATWWKEVKFTITWNTGTKWFLGRLSVYALCDLTCYRSAIDSLAHIHSLVMLWFPGLGEHSPNNSLPIQYTKYVFQIQLFCTGVGCFFCLQSSPTSEKLSAEKSFVFRTWFCRNRCRMTEQQYAFSACRSSCLRMHRAHFW